MLTDTMRRLALAAALTMPVSAIPFCAHAADAGSDKSFSATVSAQVAPGAVVPAVAALSVTASPVSGPAGSPLQTASGPANAGAEALAASDFDALPTVIRPLRRLYCVQYARLRTGFSIFGDARLWWSRAADLYERLTRPVVQSVMVFAGSKRIVHGHVAVVSAIISPRLVRVDHANWQNHGEIDMNMPVLDVSENNDWSKVRVWDPKTNQFGAHVYAISGFIVADLPLRFSSKGS